MVTGKYVYADIYQNSTYKALSSKLENKRHRIWADGENLERQYKHK